MRKCALATQRQRRRGRAGQVFERDVPTSPTVSGPRPAPDRTMRPMARFPMPDDAARGRREGRGGAGHVRRHRPPLRPGQPHHDVPHGRRLAAPGRRGRWPCGRARSCVDLACGTGDLCRELTPPAWRRSASTCRSGCWPPPAPAPRCCRATPCACPSATGVGRRRHLRVRPAQPGGAAAVLRRAGPRAAPRRAHRPARGGRRRPTRSCAGATASTSARWCRSSAACCRTPSAYRYLPRSVAYLPAPDDMLADGRRPPGSSTSSAGCCRAASPSCSRATRRVVTPASPAPAALDADVDLLAFAGRRRRAVREGPGRAGRPGLRACVSTGRRATRRRPRAAVAERWPPSRSTTRSGLPGCGPVAFGALPFTPGARRELVVPEVVVGRAEDGTRWVTTIGPTPATDAGRPATSDRGPAPTGRRPQALHGRAARPRPRATGATWSSGPPRPWRRRLRTRSCWPARSTSTADRPHRPPGGARPAAGGLPRLPHRGIGRLRGRQPRAAGVGGRRHRALPPHGRHRPPRRRPDHRPAPGGLAAGLGQGPPGAPDHHRHGPRHAAAAGARTSTTRPSRRWWRWPTSSTWRRWSRAACRSPAPSVLELVAALHPTPGGGRLAPRRGRRLDRRARGLRPRPLRRHRRVGRRRRQRHLGRVGALRRARRRHGPGLGRQRHRAPTATRPPSWPRPGPSSRRCCRRSCGPDRLCRLAVPRDRCHANRSKPREPSVLSMAGRGSLDRCELLIVGDGI